MKAAISLNDDLLRRADLAAQQMGITRSRLFTIAVDAYLRGRQNQKIMARLNAVYTEDASPAERQTSAEMKRRFGKTIRDSWPT